MKETGPPKRQIVFAVIVLAATASIAYVLNQLDQIVHGQLYNYGLQFSPNWAIPYWDLLKIIQILLTVVAASTIVNIVLVWKKRWSRQPIAKPTISPKPRAATPTSPPRVFQKPSSVLLPTQSAPATPQRNYPPTTSSDTPSSSAHEPSVPSHSSTPSETPGLIKCLHCGKMFTQPLRMLDFAGDRPRVVNICPFCSETIPLGPSEESKESGRGFLFRKKNNNHVSSAHASQSVG